MAYGVQVFGYTHFEAFETVQRNFFKRIFRLPASTPNYAIYVESGIVPIYTQNLKASANFITRVMKRSETCLHKIILRKLLRVNATPFKDWNELALSYETSLNLTETNVTDWQAQFSDVIAKVDHKMFLDNLSRASSSTSRAIYSHLNHQLPSEISYFSNEFSASVIGIIFRARVEILNLNFIPHRSDLPQLCDLCNGRVNEDIYHFVAACPILQEIRRLHFRESFISLDKLFEILNGAMGWLSLYKYCEHALSYRNSFTY